MQIASYLTPLLHYVFKPVQDYCGFGWRECGFVYQWLQFTEPLQSRWFTNFLVYGSYYCDLFLSLPIKHLIPYISLVGILCPVATIERFYSSFVSWLTAKVLIYYYQTFLKKWVQKLKKKYCKVAGATMAGWLMNLHPAVPLTDSQYQELIQPANSNFKPLIEADVALALNLDLNCSKYEGQFTVASRGMGK